VPAGGRLRGAAPHSFSGPPVGCRRSATNCANAQRASRRSAARLSASPKRRGLVSPAFGPSKGRGARLPVRGFCIIPYNTVFISVYHIVLLEHYYEIRMLIR